MSESHQTLGIHGGAGAEHHAKRAVMMRRARIAVFIILVLLCLGALRTVIARMTGKKHLEQQTSEQARQFVSVITPERSDGSAAIDLPGTLQGTIESPIYARSAGYIVSWNKDIGARAEKGELLATIAAPEVDQELSQAIATREQLVSSLALAKTSAERWEALRVKDAVSQQELDERRSTYQQAQANLAAAEANVRRLQDLESYTRVVAPFTGVVTRRNIDVGDLIDAGAAGTGRQLFSMAKVDPLRLYIYVPQTDSTLVKPGDSVVVSQAEHPGQEFKGVIARTAGAIDTTTRTLQVEISLPNPDGRLLPGAYVTVRMPTITRQSLLVPVNTLLFRKEGPRVAVVDSESNARLVPVQIGKDYGEKLEIVQGLAANDRVIVNPADALLDHQPVTVVVPQPVPPTGDGAKNNSADQQQNGQTKGAQGDKSAALESGGSSTAQGGGGQGKSGQSGQ